MSSHREAPEISKDPVADNTDVYAFVSPDNPEMVTLIANYIPLEWPPGGPNFYEFGDDVLYEIHIDNDGDGIADISYQFRFQTTVQNRNTFLYNTGPISSLTDPNWNVRQLYSLARVKNGRTTVLARELASPPCNIGPFSTPDYDTLAQEAVHVLPSGETVFAGQRAEGFYVDLGSVFDLLDLRPFQNLHINPMAPAAGVNGTNKLNVHTMSIKLPKSMLTRDGSNPTNAADPRSVIGVYASASRSKAIILGPNGDFDEVGPWVQVSRLGNPLFNEVIVPIGLKDQWNSKPPSDDRQFLKYVEFPEVPTRLTEVYPGVFPDLAAYKKARADLVAIFSPASRRALSLVSRIIRGQDLPICCGSTWPSRRGQLGTSSASWAATSPGFPMGAGCSTMCLRSSCAPSPGPRSLWSILLSPRTRLHPRSRMASPRPTSAPPS